MANSPDIEVRDLRCFLALAQELHFGRTAERLGVTSSRVSQVIQVLERRLGARLFDRSSRDVRLTAAGEKLRESLRPVIEQLDAALADVSEVAGVVRLGMYTPVNGGPHLVEIIKAFETRHPRCQVEVVDTGLDRDQFDWLRTGEADILAIRLPVTRAGVSIGPVLTTEDRVVAVALDHPLRRREPVSVEDLADYQVSDVKSVPRETMDAFIPPVTPSGRRLRRVFNRTVGEALLRVASGEIVHPTVRSFVDHYGHPGVTFVPIRDLPPSRTALAWLADRRTPVTGAFVRVAADVLSSHRER